MFHYFLIPHPIPVYNYNIKNKIIKSLVSMERPAELVLNLGNLNRNSTSIFLICVFVFSFFLVAALVHCKVLLIVFFLVYSSGTPPIHISRLIQAVVNSAPGNADVHVEIQAPSSSSSDTNTNNTSNDSGEFFFISCFRVS